MRGIIERILSFPKQSKSRVEFFIKNVVPFWHSVRTLHIRCIFYAFAQGNKILPTRTWKFACCKKLAITPLRKLENPYLKKIRNSAIGKV